MASARVEAGTARRVRVVVVGMLLTLLAAVGVSAWAQPAPPPPPPPGMDGGKGMGHGMPPGMHGGMGGMEGMHGMHGGMGAGMLFRGSPEHIGRMTDFMLDGLGASDAQRTQIKQIALQAAGDLKAQAMAARGLRERGAQIFTAPTVDAGAAEQLRQQMLQQHDQMSKRTMQAMLAVANVLTPAQRATLGQRIHDRQARMEDRMKRMQDRMKEHMKAMPPEAPRR